MEFFRRLFEHVAPSPANSYRPHLLRRRSLTFLLGLMLVTEALLVGNLALRQAGVPFLAAVVGREIVAQTNVARAANDAPALVESPLLTAAAYAKAADMAAQSYFAHVGPDGKQPWDWISEMGYEYRLAGENLAVRFVDSRDVVEAWMNSPSHKANIVKQGYTDIGVGVASGVYKGGPAIYVVQYFGTPRVHAFAGQGAAAVTSDSVFNSFVRQAGQYLADPRQAAFWTLFLVAFVLVLTLSLTIARHVQIQPVEALIPGAVVAALALALLWLNGSVLGSVPETAQVSESIEVVDGTMTEIRLAP